jgi:hypothetical protein
MCDCQFILLRCNEGCCMKNIGKTVTFTLACELHYTQVSHSMGEKSSL